MKFRWSLPQTLSQPLAPLAEALRISPLLAQCLANRGLCDGETICRYLQPRLRDLGDPFLLPGMTAAVERLLAARQSGESLVIFGDYDVDGVTATALLMETLGGLGWSVKYYFPHRLEEGYGLSREAVENCLQKLAPQLLLAVDCGSTAVSTIGWLRQKGIDVIVLDHHQVSTPLPPAVALVNPRVQTAGSGSHGAQAGARFAELCSAGLAFKLAHALVKRMRDDGVEAAMKMDLRAWLDLVALGTIADLVPMTGENRIFVASGLERLNVTQRPGLLALMSVAQCPRPVGCYEVGFQLAPRLNAAGRLEDAEDALLLLLAGNLSQAEPLARSLDSRNRQRQQIERGIAQQVIGAVRARFDPGKDFVVVEGQLSWHIGVVGIVASRVLQQFYRPSIILGGEGEVWRGSGRSVEGFDLAAALRACGDLLVTHGGHALAAGLSIHRDNLDGFRARMNELARAALRPEQLIPNLSLDGAVALADLTLEQVEELERLNPLGQGNPPVRLMIGRLSRRGPPRRMGKENQHVKFQVTDGKHALDAVWWNCGEAPMPEAGFELAATPIINDYNGRRTVQLKVLDWRSCDL
jgi:single-stranded-DNA-specific exonuclease